MIKKQISLPGYQYKPTGYNQPISDPGIGNYSTFAMQQQQQQDVIENDDDIIDYLMENNKDWQICRFFQMGTCMYGDKCHYYHPHSQKTKDWFADKNKGYDGQTQKPIYERDN